MALRDNNKACGEFASLLPLHHYGDLDGQDARAVEEHLQNCNACRAELDAIKRTLSAITPAELPPFAVARAVNRVKAGVTKKPRASFAMRFAPVLMAVLILITGVTVYRSYVPEFSAKGPDAASPHAVVREVVAKLDLPTHLFKDENIADTMEPTAAYYAPSEAVTDTDPLDTDLIETEPQADRPPIYALVEMEVFEDMDVIDELEMLEDIDALDTLQGI